MRPREVKGCAMAVLRLDGRAGRARGPSFLNPVQHSSRYTVLGGDVRIPQINQLAGMETSEDMWLNQEWLLCTFLTQNSS